MGQPGLIPFPKQFYRKTRLQRDLNVDLPLQNPDSGPKEGEINTHKA